MIALLIKTYVFWNSTELIRRRMRPSIKREVELRAASAKIKPRNMIKNTIVTIIFPNDVVTLFIFKMV